MKSGNFPADLRILSKVNECISQELYDEYPFVLSFFKLEKGGKFFLIFFKITNLIFHYLPSEEILSTLSVDKCTNLWHILCQGINHVLIWVKTNQSIKKGRKRRRFISFIVFITWVKSSWYFVFPHHYLCGGWNKKFKSIFLIVKAQPKPNPGNPVLLLWGWPTNQMIDWLTKCLDGYTQIWEFLILFSIASFSKRLERVVA